MIKKSAVFCFVVALMGIYYCPAVESQVFLNASNISVALTDFHAGDPEPFANRTTEASLMSIIDAPSVDASEVHTQSTHVWVSGGELEVIFDFGQDYNLSTFHFWNYHSESFDVDDVDLVFFDSNMNII